MRSWLLTVCKWLGYYLCMRDTPKTDTIHPDGAMFDAVIVWKGISISATFIRPSVCLCVRPSVSLSVVLFCRNGCAQHWMPFAVYEIAI